MSVKAQSVALFVRDLSASRRFYEGLLGQVAVMDHGPSVVYDGFAIWQADHAARTILAATQPRESNLGRENLQVSFDTTDIQPLFATLTTAGVEFIHGSRTEEWGSRTMRVRDPDSHAVQFGEPLAATVQRLIGAGLTEDEIARKVVIPDEVVRRLAAQSFDRPG